MARCRRGSRIMSARTGEGIVQKSGIDENDTVTSARAGRQSQLVLKLVAALVLAAIVFVFAVPRVIEGLFLGVGKGVAEVVKAPFTGAGQLVKDLARVPHAKHYERIRDARPGNTDRNESSCCHMEGGGISS